MGVKIADLKHRLRLCSMKDIVVDAKEMRLVRKDVISGWAAIEPRKRSMFSAQGVAIQEEKNRVTHRITMRYRSDVDITSAAWLYEEFLKSPPRWFKILGDAQLSGDARFWLFDALLYERGMSITPPVEELPSQGPSVIGMVPMPSGVKL